MTAAVAFREARRNEVPAVLALLRDDMLGQAREGDELGPYLAAWEAMQKEPGNQLIVGVIGDEVVACYQITVISGLSLSAARRAQIEGVRVRPDLRGQRVGEALIRDAEARARRRLPASAIHHQPQPGRRASLLRQARLYPFPYRI